MSECVSELERFAEEASKLIPHRFEVVTGLDDGTRIPAEALSEDHTVGLYVEVIPRKMRENLDGFRSIEVADLVPQASEAQGLFLEYEPLRNTRFRAERLQFLEEGWWAETSEVKYPAGTVLGLMHVMKELYGAAHLCINGELPMPLWIRSAPGEEAGTVEALAPGEETGRVEAVVQARGEGRVLLTNIHSECPMEFARRFAEAARGYYRLADE
jgi:hypothetical protein